MKVLVTGFDAFGGDKVNPSSLAVRLPQAARSAGWTIHTVELPTSYSRSADRAARGDPRGPAGHRAERGAGRRPLRTLPRAGRDQRPGRAHQGTMTASSRSIVRSCGDGPAAYLSTLPIKACVAEMRKVGLPAAGSRTAPAPSSAIMSSMPLMDMAEQPFYGASAAASCTSRISPSRPPASAAHRRCRSTTSCAASKSSLAVMPCGRPTCTRSKAGFRSSTLSPRLLRWGRATHRR